MLERTPAVADLCRHTQRVSVVRVVEQVAIGSHTEHVGLTVTTPIGRHHMFEGTPTVPKLHTGRQGMIVVRVVPQLSARVDAENVRGAVTAPVGRHHVLEGTPTVTDLFTDRQVRATIGVEPESARRIDTEYIGPTITVEIGHTFHIGLLHTVSAHRGRPGRIARTGFSRVGDLAAQVTVAVDDVPVQMGTGDVSGRARCPDPLALAHSGADADAHAAQVRVLAASIVPVIDEDHVAAAVGPSAEVDGACGRSDDRCSGGHSEVDSVVVVLVTVREAATG